MFFMTESIDSKTNNPREISDFRGENPKDQQKEKLNRPPKSAKLHKFIYGAFIGLTLASCSRLDAAFQDPAERDPNPIVQQSYQIWKEEQRTNNSENQIEDFQPFAHHESFEIPSSEQRILPGSRVQVVETGGLGLNVRAEAGVNSNLLKTAPDGTIFKVIEVVGEKDGYNWVLVKSETTEGQAEIVGYVVTDWLQVVLDQAIQ